MQWSHVYFVHMEWSVGLNHVHFVCMEWIVYMCVWNGVVCVVFVYGMELCHFVSME